MSHLLVIGFANEQKAKEGADKLLSPQKRGQIEIEDAVIATKNENGLVELRQLSSATSFWEIRAAASGYPAPTVAGALTGFGGDDKFVKEIAEAMPSGRAAVFMSGEGVVYFDSFDIRCRCRTGCFGKMGAEWTGLIAR